MINKNMRLVKCDEQKYEVIKAWKCIQRMDGLFWKYFVNITYKV